MNLNKDLEIKKISIETILKKYLPEENGYQKKVIEAMNYSINAGGKRLRPMLMQETYRALGGKSGVIEPFMAALEMIHTYSLVHDDLPAMDNDDYRRGKKTTHKVYGEDLGILAGDGLLNLAFETAFRAFDLEPAHPGIPKALQVLGKKAGIYGMIGGQTADVEAAGEQIDEDKLTFIFQYKTCALMEAAMMIGAILAGAVEADVAKIEQAASDIGFAFQIQDDILDVTSSLEVLGKPVHSDERNEKTTYVTLKGMGAAEEAVRIYSNRARNMLRSVLKEYHFLDALVEVLINREK